MPIKSDQWIRRVAEQEGMIEPFVAGQVREHEGVGRVISYGTSSYGYGEADAQVQRSRSEIPADRYPEQLIGQ